jgi:hypothetical protein
MRLPGGGGGRPLPTLRAAGGAGGGGGGLVLGTPPGLGGGGGGRMFIVTDAIGGGIRFISMRKFNPRFFYSQPHDDLFQLDLSTASMKKNRSPQTNKSTVALIFN